MDKKILRTFAVLTLGLGPLAFPSNTNANNTPCEQYDEIANDYKDTIAPNLNVMHSDSLKQHMIDCTENGANERQCERCVDDTSDNRGIKVCTAGKNLIKQDNPHEVKVYFSWCVDCVNSVLNEVTPLCSKMP